ncbi:MAG: hypothetical protein E8F57_04955, partial [Methylophaga nitratireducenticrescens]
MVIQSSPVSLTLYFSRYGSNIMKVLVIGSGGREHALAWKL